MARALVIHPDDNVAVALADLAEGETVFLEGRGPLHLRDPIPFGHKLALVDIPAGGIVRKYGEAIGRASRAIQAGEHVHVHNLEGARGRGDLEAAAR